MRITVTMLVLASALAACSAREAPTAQPAPSVSVQASQSPSPSAEAVMPSPTPSPTPSPSRSVKPSPRRSTPASSKPPAQPDVLLEGEGTFSQTAPGGTGVLGTAGVLKQYCVQTEDGITTFTPASFAAVVDVILADERSWIASQRWMFQRVSTCDSADLRVRLTTPNTTDRLCASAGVDTQNQYSCRNGNDLFINLRRWTHGVPHFSSLTTYRHMVINHEAGHYLGFSHVKCPGAGQLAPVMQTQTIALNGCQVNAFPYPDKSNYVG